MAAAHVDVACLELNQPRIIVASPKAFCESPQRWQGQRSAREHCGALRWLRYAAFALMFKNRRKRIIVRFAK
jgi:hypothetical protein